MLTMQTLAQRDSFVFEGRKRTFEIHLPPSYNGITKMPMVIAMHGGFGSGAQLQSQCLLSVKADASNFIVVYPDGVGDPILNIRTWNAGGCCGYSMNQNINDVGFISALIDTISKKIVVENKKIYATGMSNGGFMSYRLACELSNKIAAIAPVAATMNVPVCNPGRPVPVIHFHSYADDNVPFEGGIGSGVSSHYNPPADSVLNAWANKNNCFIRNDTLHKGTDYHSMKWSNCNCKYEQELYATFDGGHSWPGGQKTPTGDSGSVFINANDLMWAFFQKYSLDCPPIGFEKIDSPCKINITPNPGNQRIRISITDDNMNGILKLTDQFGRMIKQFECNNYSFVDIEVSDLSIGIYFIYLQNRRQSFVGKFLKN